MTTNAQLASQVSDLLVRWNTREGEYAAWLAGSPSGGPNSDGRYPLTGPTGVTILVACPAKLADTVEGPAAAAEATLALAEAARDAALGHRNAADEARSSAAADRQASKDHRDLTKLYRDEAAAAKVAAENASVTAHVAAFVIDGGASSNATLGPTPFAIDFGGSS
jgi:hypothetical protein